VKGDPALGNCAMVSGRFISLIDGTPNFTGDLTTAFRCLANVGAGGCGFEQHLESLYAALDNNPANVGFLRPEALLGVVVLADEDDCSAEDPALYGPETPELGYQSSFRCFEHAIQCAEGRGAELRTEGPKTGCVPLDDSPYLFDLPRYIDFLRGLKSEPHDVGVGIVLGDPEPVEVIRQSNPGSTATHPALANSCHSIPDVIEAAAPSIRLHAFAEAFGPTRSAWTSFCQDNYVDHLQRVGAMLRDMVGYPCVDGELYDPTSCELAYVTHPGTAAESTQPLPSCDEAAGARPCWRTVVDPAVCSAAPNIRLVVDEDVAPPAGTYLVGACRIN
jgi:hypothetical protein